MSSGIVRMMANPDLLHAALDYAARGMPSFPCSESQAPSIGGGEGYKDASTEPDRLRQMFAHPRAILLGMPTGLVSGFDALDIDRKPQAAEWMAEHASRLPDTRIHGSRSGGRHYLFRARPDLGLSRGRLPPGIDVRSNGGYLCMPPVGGYSVLNNIDFAHLPDWPDWLLQLILAPKPATTRPLSTAPAEPVSSRRLQGYIDTQLDAVRSAADGQKHDRLRDAARVIGGVAEQAGLSDEAAAKMLLAALPASVKDWNSARDTAAWAIREGRKMPLQLPDRQRSKPARRDHPPPHPGADHDAEPAGEPDADQRSQDEPAQSAGAAARDDIVAGVEAVIREFNRRYMMVREGGKAVIYAPGRDLVLKRDMLDRMSVADLRALYMNRTVQIGRDDKQRPVFKRIAEVWLQHEHRRQYIHGVTFDPSARRAAHGVLNLWKGFAFKPKPGDWSLLRSHIRDVICSGNPVLFDYVYGWLARMVQYPAEQGEVELVLKGGEGCGKGTLARAVMRLLGQHGLAISNPRHLVGNFNQHLRDCIFLFADEAFFAGDKQHVGALKALITEPHLTIEGKYANTLQSPNFLHVMMASNEEWVVPASIGSRRFFVLEVPDTVKGDQAYFAALWDQMEDYGYEAMLHDLLAHDISTFNVHRIPVTAGLHHQQKLSLPTTGAWWMECLERGFVFQSKHGLEAEFRTWLPKVTTDLLFASYEAFAKARGERRIISREALGVFLTGLKAKPGRWRGGIVGEHLTDTDNAYGGTTRKAAAIRQQERATGYHFGSLAQARADFLKSTGLPVNWDGGVTEDDD